MSQYFFAKDYYVNDDEWFLATPTLYKLIKQIHIRRLSEYVTVETDDKYLYIKGEKYDSVTSPLEPVPDELTKLKYQFELTEQGLTPKIDNKLPFFNVNAWIISENLWKGLPKKAVKGDKVVLYFDGEIIKCWVTTGKIINDFQVNVKEFGNMGEPIALQFDKRKFFDIAQQFKSENWLSLGKSGVMMSESNDDWSQTLLLKAEREFEL